MERLADFCLTIFAVTCVAEHQYTEANLCFELLKGRDKGKLLALSTCPGMDAHFVLVTRTVIGGTVSHAAAVAHSQHYQLTQLHCCSLVSASHALLVWTTPCAGRFCGHWRLGKPHNGQHNLHSACASATVDRHL
jgi:hypothetical protein